MIDILAAEKKSKKNCPIFWWQPAFGSIFAHTKQFITDALFTR